MTVAGLPIGLPIGALSASAAALGLAWVAIVLIALAVAGLIRQVRELRAVLIEGFGLGFLTGAAPVVLHPSLGGQDAFVLVVEPATASQELVDAFGEAARARAGAEAKLLTTEAVPDLRVPAEVTCIIDRQAVQVLRVPWYPALIHVGAEGNVLDAGPVGSVDALPQVLGRFAVPNAAASKGDR